MQYRTRIAPSPTGFAHLGTFRTAYFCYLAARASGGKFLVRIDDTDDNRNIEEAVQLVYDTMDWLGLEYDYTFRQKDRHDKYHEFATALLKAGIAFELENGAVALKWVDGMPMVWNDAVAGEVKVTQTNIDQIDGKVILLKGGDQIGKPTYQFSTVVDDWLEDMNYIIRGTDHQSNVPKQNAIWWGINQCFDAKPIPKYSHVGLITLNGKKLSKRDGAASLLALRDEGYNRDAVLNFLLRLGWAPSKDDKTNAVITKDRAITMFLTEGRMRNSNAGYDAAKLKWYDKMYKAMDRRMAA